ncbi:hypothetical protein IEQ34_010518 [Dendrobium chrysotoxum]|uniref:Uncharacterized protein n=1 Tax=Dendrobium chrysotoxum TaxID=161865 RepID=A0AAV7GDM2_DENCH|nr:hypothetical protein IEQ34_010518 [Dendrobium chrysotoxum]
MWHYCYSHMFDYFSFFNHLCILLLLPNSFASQFFLFHLLIKFRSFHSPMIHMKYKLLDICERLSFSFWKWNWILFHYRLCYEYSSLCLLPFHPFSLSFILCISSSCLIRLSKWKASGFVLCFGRGLAA